MGALVIALIALLTFNGILQGWYLLVVYVVFCFWASWTETWSFTSPFGAMWRSSRLSRHKPETRPPAFLETERRGQFHGLIGYRRVPCTSFPCRMSSGGHIRLLHLKRTMHRSSCTSFLLHYVSALGTRILPQVPLSDVQ
ncbi:hypothetical protein BJV78DRAFT_873932 [Lactifluus subvellereus]|nr:hypothetical protein BJV78DRAFT_873932 [Lactifluus subvellereus]